MWPAHGTRFSHLVSDASLTELHEFAAAAGVSERAFDRDHYDVPERLHAELVARGAERVSARELIRRLRGSGLRVPARDRPAHRRSVLTDRWERTLPGSASLGAELIDRWDEEHRHYHTTAHLLDVLEALDVLCAPDEPPRSVVLAAWFHDAVYQGVAGQDERDSAALAQNVLPRTGISGPEVAEVARLVRVTAEHQVGEHDRNAALLCDADLAVLGRDEAGYRRYLRQVREEYAHVGDADWQTGRSAVVQHLLAQEPLFHTPRGAARWADRARTNLTDELTALRGGPDSTA
ncbi:Predicted metal-dependent phosphohydrolase, HD superfamily [Ruania alba]|uniref:Predicted metal-dependent phosphohydrolase, HD superfamily n=2 Tax=Ruania alba TaxID=648782 RepID=A0A1H5MUI3_9MICO|nr:Predicted metal-dependent phosphohydrolase, HD superfamily [Ruania alba]